jgi:hypothetical protein
VYKRLLGIAAPSLCSGDMMSLLLFTLFETRLLYSSKLANAWQYLWRDHKVFAYNLTIPITIPARLMLCYVWVSSSIPRRFVSKYPTQDNYSLSHLFKDFFAPVLAMILHFSLTDSDAHNFCLKCFGKWIHSWKCLRPILSKMAEQPRLTHR